MPTAATPQRCSPMSPDRGAILLGIVESRYGTFGALYLSDEVLFANHVIDETFVAEIVADATAAAT
jgi:hypothetical protein